MSRRRGRARKNALSDEMTVWDFANQLRNCKTTKNAVPCLPEGELTQEEADAFVGLSCLLEVKAMTGGKFDRKTHIFAHVTRWDKKEGFFVQCFNSSGDKDGPALAESAENVYLLPEITREVTLGDENRRATVDAFVVPNSSVSLTYAEASPKKTPKKSGEKGKKTKAAAAAASGEVPKSKKKKRKAKKPKKKQKKRKAATEVPKRKKKKRTKKDLDKVSTSDTAGTSEANEDDTDTPFTLQAVMASYAMRKGQYMIVIYDYTHMIVIYDCHI